MGTLDTVGEIAATFTAVKAARKIDPDIGLLTKGITVIVGFKGAGALEGLLEKRRREIRQPGENMICPCPGMLSVGPRIAPRARHRYSLLPETKHSEMEYDAEQ